MEFRKEKYDHKTGYLILEYGIPHYRFFLLRYLERTFRNFHIIHSGERFPETDSFPNTKGKNFNIKGEFSLVLFNPLRLLKADVIISTFNIYKPHTWFWVLVMPWKNWILWGQGMGKSNFGPLVFFRKFIINLSKGYVVYTLEGKENLIKNGISSNKITVAGNTLKIDNAELTNGGKYFLYVGRLQERKGLDKVIEICIRLKFSLLIVGDGDLKEKWKKLYNNSEFIVFRDGVYEENELKRVFGNAIAYVSPDHVGLGVVNSFAYGVPVITNRKRRHAPEFSYCNTMNSYLYNYDSELPGVLGEAYYNRENRERKKEAAYSFYKNNLSSEKMIESFQVHFQKIVK